MDNQEENDIEIEENNIVVAPRQQKMYQNFSNFISMLGLGNLDYWDIPQRHKQRLDRIYRVHAKMVYTAPLCLISQIAYVCVNFNDMSFYVLGVTFSVLPITFNLCIKIFSTKTKTYARMMRSFMDTIHVYNKHLEEPNSAYIKSIINRTEKLSRFAAYFLAGCLLTDWTAWTTIPIVDYLMNKEQIERKERRLETCLYFYAPFDYNYNVKNWVIMHFTGAYLNLGGIAIIVSVDTLSFMFIFHLIAHIQILKHKIKTAFVHKGKSSEQEISKKLVDIIEYHAFITALFDDVQDAFGLNITANYLQNLFEDSLLLNQLMIGVRDEKQHTFIFGLMFLAYMGGLTFMSFVLEEIRRQSESFSDLVYNLPWEDMSKRNQTTVLMILAKMQPPLIFKGAGGLNTGVRPMISIIKSTFSYYVMLNSRTAG